MDKKKVMYIGIILLVIVITSITYFSYAFFTKKDEYHGRLNIVAGSLNYSIESDDLTNNSITLPSKTNKELIITVTSLNTIESKYELYYETDNSSVLVGYMEYTTDMPSGIINPSSTKTVKLLIKNNTNTNATITFSVKGGFIDKTLTVDGISISEELSVNKLLLYTNGVYNIGWDNAARSINNSHAVGSFSLNSTTMSALINSQQSKTVITSVKVNLSEYSNLCVDYTLDSETSVRTFCLNVNGQPASYVSFIGFQSTDGNYCMEFGINSNNNTYPTYVFYNVMIRQASPFTIYVHRVYLSE